MDYVSKQMLDEELRKIKKKEQDLYKFILQQFLDLEDYKKSFSDKISEFCEAKYRNLSQASAAFEISSRSATSLLV